MSMRKRFGGVEVLHGVDLVVDETTGWISYAEDALEVPPASS